MMGGALVRLRQGVDQFEPPVARHVDVGNEQIEFFPGQRRQCGGAVGRVFAPMTFILEKGQHDAAENRFVVGQQDAGGVRGSCHLLSLRRGTHFAMRDFGRFL